MRNHRSGSQLPPRRQWLSLGGVFALPSGVITLLLRLSSCASLLAFALTVGGAAPAIAEQPRNAAQGARKIDRAVRQALESGARTQRVIVKVKPGYRETLRQALKEHGDVIKSDHASIDALGADLHSADVEELEKLDWVLDIAADAIVRADAKKNSTDATLTTASTTLRETLGLPARANWPDGPAGVTVAIIDSGIAPNADFSGRITGFWDFTRGGIATAPYDDYGHGTHVAGLIGSSGALSRSEFQGVAPTVNLIGLKVLDGTGAGYTSDVIKALEFLIANKASLNVQIVNLSLGHPIYAPAASDPLVQAVERASAAGLIVVVSSGNFGQTQQGEGVGYTGITSPGNAPSAITVGAVDHKNTVTRADDVVATYSSRGPSWFDASAKPDVVAPGHKLASDTNSNAYLYNLLKTSNGVVKSRNGQELLQLSGSSMATAVTSGVAALVLQVHNLNGLYDRPAITPKLMKAILEYSAIPVTGFDRLTQGTGQINAIGAATLGYVIDTGVAPGVPWFIADIPPTSKIGDVTYTWSREIIWGHSVYGGDVIYANNIVWGTADGGDNIVWGTGDFGDNIVWGTADDGDNIVWGTGLILKADNIVWGTDVVWGTNIVWGTRLIGAMSDGGDNIVWGTANEGDNIVWGTLNASNIVWGMRQGSVILFATSDGGDNIVWGTSDGGDNIVWGTSDGGDNIIWGTSAWGF